MVIFSGSFILVSIRLFFAYINFSIGNFNLLFHDYLAQSNLQTIDYMGWGLLIFGLIELAFNYYSKLKK